MRLCTLIVVKRTSGNAAESEILNVEVRMPDCWGSE